MPVYTLKELREIAKRRGIKNYTKLSRDKLIELLKKSWAESDAFLVAQSERLQKELAIKTAKNKKPRNKPPQSPTETPEKTRRPPTVLVVRPLDYIPEPKAFPIEKKIIPPRKKTLTSISRNNIVSKFIDSGNELVKAIPETT